MNRMTQARIWSPYQTAVFDHVERGTGSAVVIAVAGSGKTTTLVEAVGRMRGTVGVAMFNKSAQLDFQAKLEQAGHTTNYVREVGTFHKFGFAAVRQASAYKSTRLDADAKQARAETEVRLPGASRDEMPRELRAFVHRLVSLAKNAGIGCLAEIDDDEAWWQIVRKQDLSAELPEGDTPLGIEWAQATLRWHLAVAPEIINFDDQLWLPLARNLRMPRQFDWFLIDEAQDTNAARRALARKLLVPGGRLVAVGDPRQAIYGFTGADADSIDLIKAEFGATELPLTISYRCPLAVVREAQRVVSHIEAAPGAEEGLVTIANYDELLPSRKTCDVCGGSGLVPETDNDSDCTCDGCGGRGVHPRDMNPPALRLGADDAVLCRKTAPLVKLAFSLIRAQIPCHVEGKEIGRGLMALATKWRTPKTIDALRTKLSTYRDQEVEKLTAKGRETQAENLADRVETLLVLMEGCPDLVCVQAKIDRMFADGAPTLTLSTVHKSKGREWGRVVVLGREEYMPSPWARQDWQQVQEQNLIYVAITRAMHELIYVSAPPEKEPRP